MRTILPWWAGPVALCLHPRPLLAAQDPESSGRSIALSRGLHSVCSGIVKCCVGLMWRELSCGVWGCVACALGKAARPRSPPRGQALQHGSGTEPSTMEP
jgi:hypothetical protein